MNARREATSSEAITVWPNVWPNSGNWPGRCNSWRSSWRFLSADFMGPWGRTLSWRWALANADFVEYGRWFLKLLLLVWKVVFMKII